MANQDPAIIEYPSPSSKRTVVDEMPPPVPFGVNEMRLTPRQWLVALAIVAVVLLATPRLWKKVERFDTGVDYRIPYALSKDYWLYERRLEKSDPAAVVVLGDSVVWGEYVRNDGTLSHFLAQETGRPFINAGVNGLFPLAMEGLVGHYAGALKGRRVIVECNVLWMTSPKADLSIYKEEAFNHSRLVPQFRPQIPCYRADASERLSVVVEEHVAFSAWVGHLQQAYYDHKSIPQWTLAEGEGEPPVNPNAWRWPWAPITMAVPTEPANDPERGPASPRHRPWNHDGAKPTTFDWVELDKSLQWGAFKRVVQELRDQRNDVLVLVGPFNEHMIAPEQRATYHAMRQEIARWLTDHGTQVVLPETLPSDMYADASHPLTQGYALLAKRLAEEKAFKRWLSARSK